MDFELMGSNTRRPRRRDGVSSFNVAIETLNLAREVSSITPAKVVFGSASIILTTIRVSLHPHYVGRLQANKISTGLGGQPDGLCRTWTSLC